MKRKKFEKAMRMHEENLKRFSCELHELVDAMLDGGLSFADAIGILETEKLYRFGQAREEAKIDELVDLIEGAFEGLEE